MNETPLSSNLFETPAANRETPAAPMRPAARRVASRRNTWIFSLSGICFLFGGLLAAQLRAIERVRTDRAKTAAGVVQAQQQNAQMQTQLKLEATRRAEMARRVNTLTQTLAATGSLTQGQIKKLNAQIKEMTALAGFAPVSGRGLRLILNDNKEASKAPPDPSGFSPLIVHDFDLLQVVNELRSAKAEAIALNGRRITAFTPIRCVGPQVLVNFEPAGVPFVIDVIGNQDNLEAALNLPGGIVDKLRNTATGPGLQVKIQRRDDLQLPASDNLPRLQNARAQ